MHYIDNYSQHSSIICSVWENGLVFVYKLSGWGTILSAVTWNVRYHACLEQGVTWHSDNYRV